MWRSFFPSERLYSTAKFLRLDEPCQSLLMRLYSVCDRWGRGPASPDMLALHIRLQRDVSQEMDRLALAGFLDLYDVDGDRFYSINQFDEDAFADVIRKRGESAYPSPPSQEKTSGRPRADQGQAKGRPRADQGQAKSAESADQGQTKPADSADQGQAKGRPEENRVEEQRQAQTSLSLRTETNSRPPHGGLPPVVHRLIAEIPEKTPLTPQQELALELLKRGEAKFPRGFYYITAKSILCRSLGDAIAAVAAEDELEKWLILCDERWRWQTLASWLRETVQRFEIPWDVDEYLKPAAHEVKA
jgi:hypothetical protein